MRYTFIYMLNFFIATVSIAAEQVTGETLYKSKCMLCHQLPEPDMLRPTQWQAVLQTMQTRMQQAGLPVMTPQEQALIFEYLTTQTDN